MNNYLLNKTELSLLVFDNRYTVDQDRKLLSRCIDGRYPNKLKVTSYKLQVEERSLPALAFPGADAGELALILALKKAYGLEVDAEKAYKALVQVIGGEKNIRIHTDSHANSSEIAGGCGHMKQLGLTPQDYQLEQSDIEFVKQKMSKAVKKGAEQLVLNGDHRESAVVLIEGKDGIFPQYVLKTEDEREIQIQIFIFHQTLVNERHRALASALLSNEAVIVPKGCDEEYLYHALSNVGEDHLMETVKRLAKGLPLYKVLFSEKEGFKIEELGSV